MTAKINQAQRSDARMPAGAVSEARCVTCGQGALAHHLHVPHLNFSSRIRAGMVLRCTSCDTFMLHPFQTAEDVEELYVAEGVFSQTRDNPYVSHLFFDFFERLYKRFGEDRAFITRHCLRLASASGNPSVLDVGCSTGRQLESFLDLAPRTEVVGTDIDPSAKQRAAVSVRDHIRIGRVEDMGFERRFDIVVIKFLIEHLLDSRPVLRAAHRALKPGGVLMVSTPNIGSAKAQSLGAAWNMITQQPVRIGHCTWYTKRSLPSAVERVGFRTLAVRSRGEVFHHFSPWAQKALVAILRREPVRNRFIRNYQLRLFWAAFVDGVLSARLGIGDQLYGFFRKP
jgi:SAM-dependent methyltransferase